MFSPRIPVIISLLGVFILVQAQLDSKFDDSGLLESHLTTPLQYSQNAKSGEHFRAITYEANYYSSIEGLSGDALMQELKKISSSNHKPLKYNPYLWDLVKEADENPINSNEVWMVFSEIADMKDNTGSKKNPNGWSREQMWPRNRGKLGTAAGAGTDGHHVRAAKIEENKKHGNKYFCEANGPRTANKICYEPPLSAKGDAARAIFYMVMRWDFSIDDDSSSDSSPKMGKLSSLLQWHEIDPVDPFELRRNNIVEKHQGNRNPFIDLPELVDFIWGSKKGQPWSMDYITQKIKKTDSQTQQEHAKEEPGKEEPVKEEPVKIEPIKTESVKEEPVKTEPVKTETVQEEQQTTQETTSDSDDDNDQDEEQEPVKEEPIKTEPIKEEPVITEPVKEEPVKSEPIKTEPVKTEPVKTEPVKPADNVAKSDETVKSETPGDSGIRLSVSLILMTIICSILHL